MVTSFIKIKVFNDIADTIINNVFKKIVDFIEKHVLSIAREMVQERRTTIINE